MWEKQKEALLLLTALVAHDKSENDLALPFYYL